MMPTLRTFRPALALLVLILPAAAQKPTQAELIQMAKSKPLAPEFRDAVRASYRPENLAKFGGVTGLGPDFLFVMETESQPTLTIDGKALPLMLRLPGTNLWMAVTVLKTGEAHEFHYMTGAKVLTLPGDIPAYGPDSYPKDGVPEGKVSEKMIHTSKIYPGMTSEYWVYQPPNYDPRVPLPVMVWQDGYVFATRLGVTRLGVVTENLIQQKKLPPMIHVAISPGTVGEKKLRSIEYDTMDGTYARFLREEILPEVEKQWPLRKDAYSRAIAGMSSGAVCAFNVAWREGEQFSRVGSFIGSYTGIGWRYGQPDPKDNIDGGNVFPIRVRKEPRRNIRVWLDDGAEDMEVRDGSWPLMNIQMANGLKMAGYDFRFNFGPGVHSLSSLASVMPEMLAWLWRDYDMAKTSQTYVQDPAEKDKPYFRVKIANR
ncbi:MAG: alpha/beta hydrolase-fold protein [Candidatus Solibacter sp.]|nr:alpha/beta hydrolase-fold protein [Candidatus Solibacter sp.]